MTYRFWQSQSPRPRIPAENGGHRQSTRTSIKAGFWVTAQDPAYIFAVRLSGTQVQRDRPTCAAALIAGLGVPVNRVPLTKFTPEGLQQTVNQIPASGQSIKRLLQAARVALPRVLPYKRAGVYTKKKLPEQRKSRLHNELRV